MAKAAGMSVEDINKQLNAQEKLNSLTSEQRKIADDAISQGLDISNIDKDQLESQAAQFSKQKEMQGQVENMSNAFLGIAATIGTVLVPLLDVMLPVFEAIMVPISFMANFIASIVGNMYILLPMLAAMGAYLVYAEGAAMRLALANLRGAIGGIFKSFSQIPLGIGIPLAVGAAAGLVSMYQSTKADDYQSGGYGKRTMFSPEGHHRLINLKHKKK